MVGFLSRAIRTPTRPTFRSFKATKPSVMSVAIRIGWAFSGADLIEAGYMMLIITYAEFIRALAVPFTRVH